MFIYRDTTNAVLLEKCYENKYEMILFSHIGSLSAKICLILYFVFLSFEKKTTRILYFIEKEF